MKRYRPIYVCTRDLNPALRAGDEWDGPEFGTIEEAEAEGRRQNCLHRRAGAAFRWSGQVEEVPPQAATG